MKDSSPVGVGIITILTVLLVLCLTIFSALTFTSARADLALSERNAETVQAYYQADAEASRLYAGFAAGTDTELDTSIPVTEAQSLYLHLVRRADGGVDILSWKVASSSSAPEDEGIVIDDYLPIWDGESPLG